jgi:phage-related protein
MLYGIYAIRRRLFAALHDRWEIHFFSDGDSCPTERFLLSLPRADYIRVRDKLQLLESDGVRLRRPTVDKLTGEIWELRLKGGIGQIRLLYFFHHERIVITHGFIKNQSKVPPQEIDRANGFRDRYLASLGKENPP